MRNRRVVIVTEDDAHSIIDVRFHPGWTEACHPPPFPKPQLPKYGGSWLIEIWHALGLVVFSHCIPRAQP
jgi:hypothetical protein